MSANDLSVFVDSSQVVTATERLKETANQALEAHRAYKTLSTQNPLERYFQTIAPQINAVNRNMREQNTVFQQSAGSINQLGVVTQQAGYQIGDFLVQVQSGTNWMVAFGQQATQLVGVLPMMGAGFMGLSMGSLVALSAGLGIAIPLVTAIGAAFMRTSEGAEEASEAMKGYQKVLDDLTSSTEKLRVENEMFLRGFENMTQTQAIMELERLQSELNAAMVEYNYLATIASETSLADAAELGAIAGVTQELRTQIAVLEEKIAKYEEEAQRAKEIEAAQTRIKRSHDFAVASMERFVEKTKESEERLRLAARQAELIKSAIGSLKDTTITVKVNFEAAFSNFKGKAAEWAGLTWQTMQSIAEGGSPMMSSPHPKSAEDAAGAIDWGIPDEPKGGGGGGKGASALDALIGQLQTEQEVLSKWYTDSQEMLRNASAEELEILGGKYEAMARLDADYRQKVYEAQQQQSQMSFQAYSGMFSALNDLLSLFAGKSKGAAIAALAIQKGLAIAQIVTSTAAAQMRAYAELGPIAGAAMAAKIGLLGKLQAGLVAATGLVQAGQILGGKASGSSGGSPGNSTVAPAGQGAGPQTVYINSIDPEGLYSGQTLMNLFDAFYNENDRRGKVFLVGRA